MILHKNTGLGEKYFAFAKKTIFFGNWFINLSSMIVRIVRMFFQENKVEDFLEIFEQSKQQIRHFEGCTHLELMRDIQNPAVFCTYSHWQSPEHLEKYRQSELFQSTWAKTKVLFQEKPIAFSLESHTLVS
jgi:quinol monooxygenase YgiN